METNYSILAAQLKELAEIDRNAVSIMANASALLMRLRNRLGERRNPGGGGRACISGAYCV